MKKALAILVVAAMWHFGCNQATNSKDKASGESPGRGAASDRDSLPTVVQTNRKRVSPMAAEFQERHEESVTSITSSAVTEFRSAASDLARIEVLNRQITFANDDTLLPLFIEAQACGSADVRGAAIGLVDRMKAPDQLTALLASLYDPDTMVRGEAVHAISAVDDVTAVALLTKALTDDDPSIRETALDVTDSSTDDVRLAVYSVHIATDDVDHRRDALDRLEALATEEAIAIIRTMLTDPDPEFREEVHASWRNLGLEIDVGSE